MNLQELHERILYPVVRVRTSKAGGSGTVIYSQPDPDNEGDFQTFVLTNHHVVDDAIMVTDEWDSVLKKKRKVDVLEQVHVELFDYVRLSHRNSANMYEAEIVAYDQNEDLAVLRLESPKPVEYIAQFISREDAREVKLFTPVWACGCSLGHDPFATDGHITYLKEDIANRLFWMDSADVVFGNSGGALYHGITGEQIGVTARVTTMQLGFSVDVNTWMNFCIPASRIYAFFDEQELRFLYDDSDTYAAAMERRKERMEKALYGGPDGKRDGGE